MYENATRTQNHSKSALSSSHPQHFGLTWTTARILLTWEGAQPPPKPQHLPTRRILLTWEAHTIVCITKCTLERTLAHHSQSANLLTQRILLMSEAHSHLPKRNNLPHQKDSPDMGGPLWLSIGGGCSPCLKASKDESGTCRLGRQTKAL